MSGDNAFLGAKDEVRHLNSIEPTYVHRVAIRFIADLYDTIPPKWKIFEIPKMSDSVVLVIL